MDNIITLKQDMNYAWTYHFCGMMYYQDLGEYDLAINDLTEAIRLDPANTFAYGLRGDAYRRKAIMIRLLMIITRHSG